MRITPGNRFCDMPCAAVAIVTAYERMPLSEFLHTNEALCVVCVLGH